MTDTAIFGSGDVVGLHPQGRHSVVAGGAVIHDAGMIEHGTNKCTGIVTHAAILVSANVSRRLAPGGGAIMTGGTIITDARVVEYRR